MELYHNLSLFPRPLPPCVPANPTGLFGITVLVNFPLCAFTFMQMSKKKNEGAHLFYVHVYISLYKRRCAYVVLCALIYTHVYILVSGKSRG